MKTEKEKFDKLLNKAIFSPITPKKSSHSSDMAKSQTRGNRNTNKRDNKSH